MDYNEINLDEFNRKNKLNIEKVSNFNIKFNLYEYSTLEEFNNIEYLLLLKNKKLIKQYNKLLNKVEEKHKEINKLINSNSNMLDRKNFVLENNDNRYKFIKKIHKQNKEIKQINIFLKELLSKYNLEYNKLLDKINGVNK